jgi:hypothetical protein
MISTVITVNAGPQLRSIAQERMREALREGVTAATVGLQSDIVGNRLHGGNPLHQRTGNLARNTLREVSQEGNATTGTVGYGSSAWYGAILEGIYGRSFIGARNLTVPAHLVTRRGGERVLTGSPYGLHFGDFSALRPSLRDNTENGNINRWITTPIQRMLTAAP